jgi:hypothetical protein
MINASRSQVALAVSLMVPALVLVAVGLIGHHNPYHLVMATRWLDHVFVYGVVAALMFGLGLTILLPRVPRVLIATLVVLVALPWAALGALESEFSPEDLAIARAPVGLGSDYEAVARAVSSGVIDPAWTISVRQTGGLLAREWQACYIEENPQFASLRWESRTRLVVTTSQGDVSIRVRARDGHPAVAHDGQICR